jgi:hypothetical protein
MQRVIWFVNIFIYHHRSGDYKDELGWAGAWLYEATGENTYLADAEANRVSGAGWGDSWDDKTTYTNVRKKIMQNLIKLWCTMHQSLVTFAVRIIKSFLPTYG